MKKYKCLCCGCRTLDARGEYDICPVCFWEDEMYPYIKDNILSVPKHWEDSGEDILDISSGANHGLTLRQGRENYHKFGACEEGMLKYVRKPNKEELEGE